MPSTAGDPVTDARTGAVMADDPRVTIVDDGRVRTVRFTVAGDLDLVAERALVDDVVDVVRDTRPDRLVLDLTGVPFLDSSGLRGLLRCARAAEDHGVLLTLDVVPGPVTMLLDTAGVRNWFGYE
ncbi:STAS domain-containing protein [Jatrophihabitans sp. YIM 134969]